eukprot:TRINITY_DN712_c0_g5_i1.p1 TRINITY_DN712_c0_g5~~TRINITY_DN712_c0_g5_i1.p1  ORF type:complete len:821 (-),score=236.04 TRINITY_DN712_c0_g5_i1:149-2611(-)
MRGVQSQQYEDLSDDDEFNLDHLDDHDQEPLDILEDGDLLDLEDDEEYERVVAEEDDEEGLMDEEMYLEQISKAHRKAKARTSATSSHGPDGGRGRNPVINKKSRALSAKSRRGLNHLKKELTPLSANYGELLYEEFKSKDKAREQSVKEAERERAQQQEAEQAKPAVHAWATSRRNHNSIDVRSQVAVGMREKKIAAMRDKIDQENGVTFTPKINKVKGQHRDSVLQEMKMREKRRQQKLLALQEAVLAHEESSFTPKINQFSQSLVRQEPVHERLFRLQKEKEINQTLKQVQQSEALRVDPETGQKMFQPQINLGECLDRNNGECVQEALYRDAENRRLRREMAQEQTALEDKMLRAAHKMTSYSKKLVQAKTDRELQQVFDELDTHERGWISYQDVAAAVKKLGLFGQSGRHHRNTHERAILQKVWTAVDPDQTGSVTADNFVLFMSHVLGFNRNKNSPEVPEHMQRIARELGSINTTKLSYTQIGHTRAMEKSDEQQEAGCTFKPKINPKSEEIDNQVVRPSTKPSERHELLYKKAMVTKKKKQDALLEYRDRELKGCTFKPKINKTTAKLAANRGKEAKNHFEYLYKLPKKSAATREPVKSTEERELEQHCTFKPNVKKPLGKVDKPARRQVPKGYEDSINRVRQANEDRELQRRDEERFYSVQDYEENRARFQAVKPFEFALDARKDRPKPLLIMEVNLGIGKSGRIGIYEGDEPAVLAHNFATTYQLDDDMCFRLEELIVQQLACAGARSPRSRDDDDGYSDSGSEQDGCRQDEEVDAEVLARQKLRQRQQRIINSRQMPQQPIYSDSEEDSD